MGAKRKGAQPGNINALKHGYYSRRFRTPEIAELKEPWDGLQDEIALLRVLMRRVFETAHEEEDNLETWSRSLSTLGVAATRLASVLKAQKALGGDESSEWAEALSRALSEMTREMGI